MSPGTADESNYLIDEGGSILGGNYRFADAAAYMVYQFDLPDDLTSAVAQISVGESVHYRSGRGGQTARLKLNTIGCLIRERKRGITAI